MQDVHGGTGAMRAYQEMMYGVDRDDVVVKDKWAGLLRQYCRLDRLNMVLVLEHWRRLIGGYCAARAAGCLTLDVRPGVQQNARLSDWLKGRLVAKLRARATTARLTDGPSQSDVSRMSRAGVRLPRGLSAAVAYYLVLDPFAGSNTTGATAESLGRRWLSVEANRDYARSGLGRFPEDAQTNAL